MYIEKTKTNKYKFIEIYIDDTGKRRKVSITLDKNTKQIQNKAYAILQEKIQKQTDIFNVEYRFLDVFEKYVEYKEKTLKASSLLILSRIYKSIQKKAQNWKLEDIKAKHLLSIFDENELNLRYKFSILKDFIKWCYKKDYIDDISFLQKIEIKKQDKKEKEFLYLEKNQLDDILNFFKDNELMYNMILILINTGLRIGELLALNYSDLNGTTLSINKTLYMDIMLDSPKSKTSIRNLEVNQVVIQSIQNLKERQKKAKILEFGMDRIFVGVNKMTYSNFFKQLKHYKKINLNPHLFRHTHASLLIEKGIPVEAVSRRLGHSDTKITQSIYIHLTDKLKEKENKIFRELIL